MDTPAATLLVVDDNEENRDMLARRLERKGFRVRTAAGGREALDMLAADPVDLVLLDVMMPEVGGLDVLRQVRQSWTSTQLPVIMVSAATESPQIVEALKLGANDYVTKPVDFPVCLARVQGQLARRQAAPPAPPAFRAEVGATLGPYRLDALIGEGGMGAVYRAHDPRLGRDVALKVVTSAEGFGGDEALQRFLQEARAVARIRHPHVVAIYDVGMQPCPFLAMEFVSGGTLEDLLGGRTVPSAEAARLCADVADALAAVHARGVIHRDLKPANVLLDAGGGVHVTDFGLARLVDRDLQLTQQGSAVGTPTHMAPEQLDGSFGSPGPATDLWALGVILYEMVTGRLPFSGKGVMQILHAILTKDPVPPRQVNPHLPKALEAVCLRALTREASGRFASAEEMRDALRAAGA